MGVGAWVDQDAVDTLAPCLMNAIDQRTFVVRLKVLEPHVEISRGFIEGIRQRLERDLPVQVWFTGPQQIEVWTL